MSWEKELHVADKRLDFVVIPKKVIQCEKLSANAKLLMGVIINLCNSRGNCWASNQYLAEIFGTHFMTVSKWVNSLEDNGFVKCKIKRVDRKRKIYVDPSISKGLVLYAKSLIVYKSNHVHIHKEQGQLEHGPALSSDDFDIETKEWIDEDGVKRGRDSIDYEQNVKT